MYETIFFITCSLQYICKFWARFHKPFSSLLFHFTGSLGGSMFEEMQMVVHEESSIRGLFYSEYPQNWLYGFFNISPYQLPSFLNNFRRNQFRINYPVFLLFQGMGIIGITIGKCLIKNGFVQNLHGGMMPCFLSIVRCISCRWMVVYSEWLQDHL